MSAHRIVDPEGDSSRYLASLFHPQGANDVAPRGYNAAELAVGLPVSPLAAVPAAVRFRWGEPSEL